MSSGSIGEADSSSSMWCGLKL